MVNYIVAGGCGRKRSLTVAPLSGLRGSEDDGWVGAVVSTHLAVQCPEVDQVKERDDRDEEPHARRGKAAQNQQPDACGPFVKIKPLRAEKTEEDQQQPGQRIVERSGCVLVISAPVHRGDEEQVNQPADAEQAKSEE